MKLAFIHLSLILPINFIFSNSLSPQKFEATLLIASRDYFGNLKQLIGWVEMAWRTDLTNTLLPSWFRSFSIQLDAFTTILSWSPSKLAQLFLWKFIPTSRYFPSLESFWISRSLDMLAFVLESVLRLKCKDHFFLLSSEFWLGTILLLTSSSVASPNKKEHLQKIGVREEDDVYSF